MKTFDILSLFEKDKNFQLLVNAINNTNTRENIFLKNLSGSQKSILATHVFKKTNSNNLFILDNLE